MSYNIPQCELRHNVKTQFNKSNSAVLPVTKILLLASDARYPV